MVLVNCHLKKVQHWNGWNLLSCNKTKYLCDLEYKRYLMYIYITLYLYIFHQLNIITDYTSNIFFEQHNGTLDSYYYLQTPSKLYPLNHAWIFLPLISFRVPERTVLWAKIEGFQRHKTSKEFLNKRKGFLVTTTTKKSISTIQDL